MFRHDIFHIDLLDVARVLPIPRELLSEGIQRYGFHGLSCVSILRQLGGDRPARLIIAHLGNGASVAALALPLWSCADLTRAFPRRTANAGRSITELSVIDISQRAVRRWWTLTPALCSDRDLNGIEHC